MFKEDAGGCPIGRGLQRTPGVTHFAAGKKKLAQDETQINDCQDKRYTLKI